MSVDLGKVTVTMGAAYSREYLSRGHLISAAHCARTVSRMEKSFTKKEIDISTMEVHATTLIRSCFISSVCFLESTINELIVNISEGKTYRDVELNRQSSAILSRLYGEDLLRISGLSWLNKYSLILCLYLRQPLSKGEQFYQDVVLLNELRNAIIHFVPEFVQEFPCLGGEKKNFRKSNLN